MSHDNKTFVTKRITNQHIYDLLQATHDQAKKTNGRVTILEEENKTMKRRSVGHWIGEHPFKFSGYVMIFFAVVISDIRHPLISSIIKLWA